MRPKTVSPLFWWVLLLMVAFCCGCGSADKGSGPGQITPACAMLSQEQVGKILGEEFGVPQAKVRKNKQGAVVMSSCTFSPVRPDSFTSLNILVVPRDQRRSPQAALAEHLRSLRENLKNPGYTLETVTGVGQAAGYDPLSDQLTIMEQQRMLILTLQRRPKEQNQELLIKLGRLALLKK